MADDKWDADRFEDGSTRLVGEQHVENMETFAANYAQELLALEDVLDAMASSGGDLQWDAIVLDTTAYEAASVVDLVHTPSKPVTKVTLALAALCEEMAALRALAEPRFFAPLALYGELTAQHEMLEGDTQVQLARLLPLLVSLSQFVTRCGRVLQCVVRQLAQIHHAKQPQFEGVHFTTVWKYVAQLLEVLITLDALLADAPVLTEAWGRFKRMLATVKKAPGTYGVEDEARLWQLDKLLLQLQGSLLDANVVAHTLRCAWDEPALGVVVRANPVLKAALSATLKALHQDLLATQASGAASDAPLGRRYLAVCALFALHHALFEDVKGDKKLLQSLWELQRHFPFVPLYARAGWSAHTFFALHMPLLLKEAGLDKKEQEAAKRATQQVTELTASLAERVRVLELRIARWLVHAESAPDTLKIKSALLLKGVQLAQALQELVTRYLALLHLTQHALKGALVPVLLRALVLLKALHAMYQRRAALIAEATTLLSHRLAEAVQRLLMPALDALSDVRRRASDAALDARAAATLAVQMLNGPPTRARTIVFRLAFHQLPPSVLAAAGTGIEAEITQRIAQWSELAQLGTALKRATDAAWLTWTPQLLSPWLALAYRDARHARALPWLFAALRDAVPLFRCAVHEEPHALLTAWRTRILDALQREIVEPLCAEIHRDLTEQVHHARPLVTATLSLGAGGAAAAPVAPARRLEGGPFAQRDVARLLALPPLRVYDASVDVRAQVAHYLERTFYNLNTVALYDWATFGVMRSLAADKYGLELQDAHLPGQTLEQGLDVLEIMRHIASFVAAYRYNLHNQIFVEAASEHKTLQAIGVQHIANSIRTHGPGIMSTAVSVTYQFLKEKVHLFSQFLFDEMIKSRLYRDLRAFKELKKEKSSNYYPYERAKKFVQYVRQLSTAKSDRAQSYLDKFRRLITEMGNAMGYVRMIRSGGLLYTSTAIQFVPDLTGIQKFEELVTQAQLSPESAAAAHNLDGVVETLSTNFASGTDYYKMLVNVFKAQYDASTAENAHLANFHLSVPALTLSFVEHISQDKERYAKRRAEEGVFTDDGFAVGVAYLLKLTGTEKDFDALNWFQSVRQYYTQEMQASAKDRENVKIAALTRSKLQAELKEFELLRYTFQAARIFFHD